MKSSDVVKIILLSIIAFLLVMILMSSLFNSKSFFSFKLNSDMKEIFNEEFEIEDVNLIKIDTLSTDIEMNYSEDDKVKVIINGDEDDKKRFSISFNNNTILVKQNLKTSWCFGICWYSQNIVVYIPESYKNNVEIDTKSGDLVINDNFDFKIDATLVSGDFKARNLGNVKIKTTSGDIKINKANDVNLSTVSGDIEVDSVNNIEAKTISGDIELGSVVMNKNGNIKTTSGDVKIRSINTVYIETKTVSGDVNIKNNDRYADYQLNIETVSGDIRVS